MTITDYTKFKIVTQIGDSLLMNELENNLKTFLDWSFLGIGAWFNASTGVLGAYGGDTSTLRAVDDPQYTLGQVWEGRRKDWVWETGVGYTLQPTAITGVVVDGSVYGTGDATYGHHINYPLGRVIFDTAIATTKTVQVEHSYRWIQVYRAHTENWWKELQYNTFRDDNSQFDTVSSGEYSILANHRVQLPCILIEVVPRRNSSPYELGNGALIVQQDVLFHVMAEDDWMRNQLTDILALQQDKRIYLFNTEDVINSGVFPVDYRGMLVNNPTMYPTLVEEPYRWRRCTFLNSNTAMVDTVSSNLYASVVTLTAEVIMGAV